MPDRPLTVKQETFCKWMFTPGSDTYGNGTESARKAGHKGTDNYLARVASENVRKCKIVAEKARIQAETSEKMGYSIEKYRKELDEAREHAQALRQPSAEVSAIVAKGRSCGYDKDNDMGNKESPDELSPEKAELYRTMAQAALADKLKGPKLSRGAV